MKKAIQRTVQLSTALFVSIVITACGGGGSDTAGNAHNDPSVSGKLVIDNGRGTTNNQDTERVK